MPKEFFKLAGDAGLLCCMVPEEYGGPGGDILDQAVMCEEQWVLSNYSEFLFK